MNFYLKLTASILAGYVAWDGLPGMLAVSLFFPVLWFHSESRWQAGAIALVYHLSSTKSLVIAAATYFASGYHISLLLWSGGCLLISSVYFFLWSPDALKKYTGLMIAFILTGLPPLGVIGWAHPITSGGILFPGLGFMGLTLTLLLIFLMIKFPKILIPYFAAIPFISCPEISPPPGWKGINTRFEFTQKRDLFQDYLRQSQLMDQIISENDDTVLVFPESSAGQWSPENRNFWLNSPAVQNKKIILGAELARGNNTLNSLILLSNSSDIPLYHQRQPVPLSMWRPWATGTKATWFGSSTFELESEKVASLICYETFLFWPVLQAMSQEPSTLLVTGNLWWTKDTSISLTQKAIATAWARLFNLKLVMAVNI